MSKRLQVLLEEAEFARFQQVAEANGCTLAEWVRQSLRNSCAQQPTRPAETKIAAVRAAARHQFPAPDIDQMLAEIDRGARVWIEE